MRLIKIMQGLERIAPLDLAEDWDKVGLHLGDPSQNIRRVLLCIDLTPAVYEEAVTKKCDLVLAYHPPIFKPLDHVTAEHEQRWTSSWKEDMVYRLIRKNIAVYAPHTALDAVRGGMNDWLCDGLGTHEFRGSLTGHKLNHIGGGIYKIVVFVPTKDAEAVRRAMFDAGAGGIGANYTDCSFSHDGTGTFRPVQGANPTIGEIDKLERVEETRIETICDPNNLGYVLRAMRDAHPYEEPAYDLYERATPLMAEDEEIGSGRIHRLRTPITVSTLLSRVKKRLGVSKIKVAIPDDPEKIEEIAVCVGAGGSVFEKYPPVGAYVTGEMNHHQVLDLVQKGSVVILAGHTNTERPFLPTYRERIRREIGEKAKIEIEVSEADRSPMAIV